ncbi:MAG TPA: putative glycolipid-binding domain-containing protein [Acidimicrobiales bacterium]|nr:putative glycolipid-binding domain-containing protein [Acidimicrobiales bacterium]
MSFVAPPPSAAWLHQGLRSGFEVVYIVTVEGGYRLEGCATAVEGAATWIAKYEIWLDSSWTTQRARISSRSSVGWRSTALHMDDAGRWDVDGQAAPHLDGCRDVDLECSAMTNALPVHRMALAVGGQAVAPAAYVRAADLKVERLEQTYARVTDESLHQRFDYVAPAFGFACRLVYDEAGLVLDYPGIAVRAG